VGEHHVEPHRAGLDQHLFKVDGQVHVVVELVHLVEEHATAALRARLDDWCALESGTTWRGSGLAYSRAHPLH